MADEAANLRTIAQLEELTLNAWPSPRQVLLDGWVIRIAGGYTRRANSVHPMRAGTRDVGEKIEACEAIYRRAGLRTTFKLTAASAPTGLDTMLVDRGYAEETGASVQALDLTFADATPSADLRTWDASAAEWVDAYTRFNDVPPRHGLTLRSILEAIPLPAHFAALTEADELCACGLAVRQDEWVGLYDIATRPDRRRRGLGRRLVESLLGWGKANGARRAYLQVATGNAPAENLYAKLGFRECYQYRYFAR